MKRAPSLPAYPKLVDAANAYSLAITAIMILCTGSPTRPIG